MIRTIIWLLAAAILLILVLPYVIFINLFGSKDKYAPIPKGVIWTAKNLLPFMTSLGGCKLTVEGSENLPKEPALYVGNHQGLFDVFIVFYALGSPKATIAKIEASKVPVARLWMKKARCIFMDRKNIRQSLGCIKEATDYLKHGIDVLVFPEGTRSRGPMMNEFKPGAFKAAIDAGVKIVPFVIDGTYKAYEEHHLFKKADVKLSILPPVEVLEGEKSLAVSDRVQELISNELERLRQ